MHCKFINNFAKITQIFTVGLKEGNFNTRSQDAIRWLCKNRSSSVLIPLILNVGAILSQCMVGSKKPIHIAFTTRSFYNSQIN